MCAWIIVFHEYSLLLANILPFNILFATGHAKIKNIISKRQIHKQLWKTNDQYEELK